MSLTKRKALENSFGLLVHASTSQQSLLICTEAAPHQHSPLLIRTKPFEAIRPSPSSSLPALLIVPTAPATALVAAAVQPCSRSDMQPSKPGCYSSNGSVTAVFLPVHLLLL